MINRPGYDVLVFSQISVYINESRVDDSKVDESAVIQK